MCSVCHVLFRPGLVPARYLFFYRSFGILNGMDVHDAVTENNAVFGRSHRDTDHVLFSFIEYGVCVLHPFLRTFVRGHMPADPHFGCIYRIPDKYPRKKRWSGNDEFPFVANRKPDGTRAAVPAHHIGGSLLHADILPSIMKRMARLTSSLKKAVGVIGPGVITGASDDDPSGIATCSQAGAVAGPSLLWTAVFTTPLMISIQEMCARIGLVTGKGLTGVLLRHRYPKTVLAVIAFLVLTANTINIGADLQGMSAAAHLLIPLPEWLLSIGFAVLISVFMVFSSYQTFSKYMKWLTLALLCYIFTPFALKIDWATVLRSTLIPKFQATKEYLTMLVALFGTIISPYLFFWQAEMEVEDKRNRVKRFIKRWIVTKHELRMMEIDVTFGMILSNVAMWFIILTAALTLFPRGIVIGTAEEAAMALRPLVGDFAYTLFTVGIVGTGMLAIPVLAGSSSYVLSEILGWSAGMNKSFHKAKRFYLIIVLSTLIGVFMHAVGIDPIQALIYTAVIYGVISPILILIIMHIANNKKVMGKHTNSPLSNILGGTTFLVMAAAAVLFLVFTLR